MEEPTSDNGKDEQSGSVGGGNRYWKLLKFSSVGLEMAVATFVGWALGHWLDGQFGTEPWLMLVFLLLGVAAGFKGVFRAAREAQEIMNRGSDGGGETRGQAAESKEGGARRDDRPGPDRDDGDDEDRRT